MGELEKRGLEWHVTEDKMRLFGRIRGNEPCTLSPDEVIRLLEAEGINSNFDPDSIQTNLQDPTGQWFLIARGTPPVPAQPGELEFQVDLENLSGAAVETETGKVDYKHLKMFVAVEEGQVIVKREETQPGKPGMDVFGKDVSPPEGSVKPLPVGEGVDVDETGNIATAKVAGAVLWEKNLLVVKEVFIIGGDVSYRSGNIEYRGAVEVRGDVLSGFEINAGGDVWVRGTVEAATIISGGSVTILGGFQGDGRGTIQAEGTIKIGFANDGKLTAGKDILVRSSLLNCEVSAGEQVIVESSQGGITGGEVRAGLRIQTSNAGSNLGVITILRMGLDPDLVEKIKEAEEALKVISASATAGQNRKRDLMGFLRSLSQWEAGEVLIQGTASPGVEICFPRDKIVLNSEGKHARYSVEETRVRMDPITAGH